MSSCRESHASAVSNWKSVTQETSTRHCNECDHSNEKSFSFDRLHFWSTMWCRWLVSSLPILLLCELVKSMPTSNYTFKINPKPCAANGYGGTCMFVWECIKSEGQHLGMCVDSFMFGSCCAHNLTENIVPHEHFNFKIPIKKPRPPNITSTSNRPNLR